MERVLKFMLKLIFRWKGYRFYQATNSEENEEAIALGSKLLREEGYDDQYIAMIEQYYPDSVLFLAKHKGKLIGAARLLDPAKKCRAMDFWNLEFPDTIDLAELRELGMLSVDKNYRGKSRWPITGLIEVAYYYSKENGIQWWLSSAVEEKYEKFKQMNPSCQVLRKMEPTSRQLQIQQKNRMFFEKYDPITRVFVFSLKDASYGQQFRRILRKIFRKKRG